MRLTLRTLLAYLDNILDPADRELLAEKIRESEFAQSLVQRTRDVINDPELSAADPIGRGLGHDSNSAAEYLDNTMAREQIEEFERLCLDVGPDANTQLAEITSCHHILTMVLGEPVQFEPASRERMYRMVDAAIEPAQDVEEQEVDAMADSQAEAMLSGATAVPSSSVEQVSLVAESSDEDSSAYDSKVPDYLRGQPKSRTILPVVATALVAAIATGVILMFFDSKETSQPPAIVAERVNQQDTDIPQDSRKEDKNTSENAGTAAPLAVPDDKATSPAANENVASGPDRSAGASDAAGENLGIKSGDGPQASAAPPVGTAADNSRAPVPSSGDQGPVKEQDDASSDEVGEQEKTPEPQADESSAPPTDGSDKPAGSTDATPQTKNVMGRLLSHDQILLATPNDFDGLRRLPRQSSLKNGQKLLALPAFRPNISIVAMTIELDGGTMIELLGIDDGGVPVIAMHYGRIVVRTNIDGSKLRVRVGDERVITLTLDDTSSAGGLEIWQQRVRGSDPETAPKDFNVDLYVLSGSVNWQENEWNGVVRAEQWQDLTTVPPSETKSSPNGPEWLTKTEASDLDKRAKQTIEQSIRTDKSVNRSMLELSDTKRYEIKQLALRCCAHVGYYDPLINALNQEEEKGRWKRYADQLYEAVDRSPQAAQQVRACFEQERGPKGFELYRMLWGYSNPGLNNNGEAAQLVAFLESDDLDFRVLSHWNLKKITGKGLTYQPHHSELKRKQLVKRWQKLLDAGEITHKNSPANK